MTAILFLLGLAPGPDLDRLGSDDWRTREAEHRRCDNPLFAVLLPPAHSDPEIDRRVKAIRTKWVRKLSAEWVGRRAYFNAFDNPAVRDWLLTELPIPPGENWGFLNPPAAWNDWERFRTYVLFNLGRVAPEPHEKPEP